MQKDLIKGKSHQVSSYSVWIYTMCQYKIQNMRQVKRVNKKVTHFKENTRI